jgi:hypothetical protein
MLLTMNKIYPPIEPNSERGFDCVKMMRDIRNKIDVQIAKMTFAEQKEFYAKLSSGASKI